MVDYNTLSTINKKYWKTVLTEDVSIDSTVVDPIYALKKTIEKEKLETERMKVQNAKEEELRKTELKKIQAETAKKTEIVKQLKIDQEVNKVQSQQNENPADLLKKENEKKEQELKAQELQKKQEELQNAPAESENIEEQETSSNSEQPLTAEEMASDQQNTPSDTGDMTLTDDPLSQSAQPGTDMMGFDSGNQQIEKNDKSIGRLYELRKIYLRLYIIEKILNNSTDRNLLEISNVVKKAFEVYRIVIQNLKSFQDRIDDVIVDYYKFIKVVTSKLEKYFLEKNKENILK